MRSARLLGHGHHELGAIAAVAEDGAAITLSRGGARKTYSHVDANEDAVCFALGAGGCLLAVADGHYGARGAECAIEEVLERYAPTWTDDPGPFPPTTDDASGWSEAVRALLHHVHDEVVAQGAALRLPPAPTTLSLALVRPREGLLLHASIGDCHVFRVSQDADPPVIDLGWARTGRPRTFFLGDPYEGGAPDSDHWLAGCEPLAGVRSVVVASDGLSERGIGLEDPAAAVREAVAEAAAREPELRALETCRAVAQRGIDAQRRNASGDNLAVAVVWLG